jgi:hypothetical protein
VETRGPPTAGAPSVADVDAIVALADPVLRNLRITQCYHELSLAFHDRFGGGANWCTFATWASRQAGRSIRREDLSRAVEQALGGVLSASELVGAVAAAARALGAAATVDQIRRRIREVIDPGAAAERSAAAVARGNLKVFREIGREFARYLAGTGPGAPELSEFRRFLDALRPGDPPDGQRYLRSAFERYHRARSAADPRERTELMLLGNLEIGFHEQTRLQPEISEAVDIALPTPEQLSARLVATLFPAGGVLVRARLVLRRLLGGPTPLDRATAALIAEARRAVRHAITDHLMTLDLAATRLRLGDDLRARFPDSLRQLANADLRALLGRIDPTPDSTLASGARDWADLPDRMHFIADLFRCYHEVGELLEPPFTPAQVAAMRAATLPGGEL